MKRYEIGITFGAFDPLHYGHIKLFERAKEQCERLIVCVSHTDYIKKHKGHWERIPLEERIYSLNALRYVDETDVQSEMQDKRFLVAYHKADVIFVGDDWSPDTFTGEGLEVPVVYLPRTPGISSTQLAAEEL